jgi:hypothetical protein
MRILQAPERIKEAPAQALRAVFAGVGQVLLVTERIRRRTFEYVTTAPVPPAGSRTRDVTGRHDAGRNGTAPPATTAPAATMASAATMEPAVREAPADAPDTAVREAPADAPDTAVREAPAAAPAPVAASAPVAATGPSAAEGRAAAALPLPNYSEMTFASLRARMRGLDTDQLRVLVSYERAHEDRANVITMLERRIAKLEGAEGADTATP